MIGNNKIVAIIPARGGSKGIPRKNIKELNKKPLIAYSIEEALKSKYIDRVIVSTEDLEIANISKSFGAEIPFMRPDALARDNTPGIEPIIHCIEYLREVEKYDVQYIICLQCTTPLRTSVQIDEAIEKIVNSNNDSLVSVTESEISPFWMKKIVDDKLVDFIEDSTFYARRQDAPEVYTLNGAIYIAKTELLLKNRNWYTENTLSFIMDRVSSIDIDDLIDFKFAEFLLNHKENFKDEDII
ncbi:cytidylyltransferase domain-containing protein [Clostridium manihotivorum]|uniref:Acylneuraminate cytidylyltransferase n=1 Tax=Clostridium manihotivorum TaxID=2320868 RepID=A0A3R5U8C2_9CLOT|nr:acylneuraminate cytidylyltransferase family protein [Clostridium manihotivorum]QAA31662.1 acylneuraminate cytidylyltransferase [Clostridium manihotivorum]